MIKLFISNLTGLMLIFICVNTHAQNSNKNLKNEPIIPIPLTIDLDQNKISLGEKLFNDTRLSKSNSMSCSSCHQIEQGGDDGLARSVTNSGAPDLINAPTVFNSVFNFRQTWRGAFKTLELQAEGDLKNPRHGATNWQALLPKLKSVKTYVDEFYAIYRDEINREAVLDAIATYEKSLITPNSRFDLYLRGNDHALSKDEKEGYRYFKVYGCIACHQGVNIGGNVFQKFGMFDDYFKRRGNILKADYGYYNVTKNEDDRFVFRVPSLRNVAVTAPYLHDGSVEKLEDVVEIMAQYQLGTTIEKSHVKKIVKFLKTLTGQYKGKYLDPSITPFVDESSQ